MKEVYEKILKNIPDYKEFLTLEELDESSKELVKKYPSVAEIFEIGRTRENRPIYCLKIGKGSKNALVFGCPHPNEPIGTMTMEYFAKCLAENQELREELDYTWYFVKAWDADGYKLNEGWIKGPYTIYNYSRNFFRPAGHKQVDWTFPIDYKELHFHSPIPETIAMMKLIDDIKPKFIYSLHNAGFGGAYWYITHDVPELYDSIRNAAVKVDVPLNLGEPEAPYCVAYSPAIYQDIGIENEYDFLEKYGAKNIGEIIKVGTCSAGYAKGKYNSVTLLTELPYFYDERIKDLNPGTMTRKAAVLEKLKWTEESNRIIMENLSISEKYMDEENPYLLAIKAFCNSDEIDATRNMVEEDPEFARTATVAEEFDNLLVNKFYRLLSYGMLIRANEFELSKMEECKENNPAKKESLLAGKEKAVEAHKVLSEYLEKEINYKVVPIKNLISIQLEAGLLVSDYVHDR